MRDHRRKKEDINKEEDTVCDSGSVVCTFLQLDYYRRDGEERTCRESGWAPAPDHITSHQINNIDIILIKLEK